MNYNITRIGYRIQNCPDSRHLCSPVDSPREVGPKITPGPLLDETSYPPETRGSDQNSGHIQIENTIKTQLINCPKVSHCHIMTLLLHTSKLHVQFLAN